jgi:hypothetical protein
MIRQATTTSLGLAPTDTGIDRDDYLGPARVTCRVANHITVALEGADGKQVSVEPAFTFPYEAAVDDQLLVLGQGERYYAVGVLSGQAPCNLSFPGDVTIRALAGKLTLASEQAVELCAPRITLRAGLIRTLANEVIEKANELRRWVRGLLAIRAGQSRRVVDGEDTTRCQNSTTLAKDTVTVDGDQLHLGH